MRTAQTKAINMRSLISTLLVIALLPLYGQGNKMVSKLQKEGAEWNDGTLFLTNETQLTGQIQYNDKNGTLSIKTEGGSESYSANTVSKFSFFDTEIETIRNFISLDYPLENLKKGIVSSYSITDSKTSDRAIVPTFFEVLEETKEFAILSKMKPINYKEKKQKFGVGSGGVMVGGAIIYDEVKQSEILFFLTLEGEIIPYIEFKSKEIYNVSFATNARTSNRKRKLNSDLLEEMTGEHYESLMKFAAENNLKPKRREDFLKIIDYYKLLSSKSSK